MTNALALLLSELIPIMIAGRSVVAAWMWTAPSLIGDDADDDELLLSAWAVARKRIDHANALPHVVLVIVVLLVELRRLLKCRCTSVEDEDDNDHDVLQSDPDGDLRTAPRREDAQAANLE